MGCARAHAGHGVFLARGDGRAVTSSMDIFLLAELGDAKGAIDSTRIWPPPASGPPSPPQPKLSLVLLCRHLLVLCSKTLNIWRDPLHLLNKNFHT